MEKFKATVIFVFEAEDIEEARDLASDIFDAGQIEVEPFVDDKTGEDAT